MTQQYNYRSSQDLKSQATGIMTGKFTGGVMITLSYIVWIYLISLSGSIITSFISKIPAFSQIDISIDADIVYVVITTIITAFFSLLTGMFTCGLCLYFLKLTTGAHPMGSDLLYGFRENAPKVFTLCLLINSPVLTLSIPFNVLVELYSIFSDKNYLYLSICFACLSFFTAIYMHLTYGMSYYMMLDFPKYSPTQIMGITRKKMNSHRARLLSLEIRFIPLVLLGILSMGVGFLWIYPIFEESRALFFLNLMNPDHYIKIDERI